MSQVRSMATTDRMVAKAAEIVKERSRNGEEAAKLISSAYHQLEEAAEILRNKEVAADDKARLPYVTSAQMVLAQAQSPE